MIYNYFQFRTTIRIILLAAVYLHNFDATPDEDEIIVKVLINEIHTKGPNVRIYLCISYDSRLMQNHSNNTGSKKPKVFKEILIPS